MFSLSLQVQQYYKDSHHETSESDSCLPTPLVAELEAADPVAAARSDPLPEPEFIPVVDAVAMVGDVEGVILGPGPVVIISPFPPGYLAPAAAVKSGVTAVSLLTKKYMATTGDRPVSSKNNVRLKFDLF